MEKTPNIQTLSEAIGRASLAFQLGMQYNGDRDLYAALGYPLQMVYSDYAAKYKRHEVAKAVIDRPVEATWAGDLILEESKEAKDTVFEAAWKALNEKLGLKTLFSRADKLTGLGRYGIMLFRK